MARSTRGGTVNPIRPYENPIPAGVLDEADRKRLSMKVMAHLLLLARDIRVSETMHALLSERAFLYDEVCAMALALGPEYDWQSWQAGEQQTYNIVSNILREHDTCGKLTLPAPASAGWCTYDAIYTPRVATAWHVAHWHNTCTWYGTKERELPSRERARNYQQFLTIKLGMVVRVTPLYAHVEGILLPKGTPKAQRPNPFDVRTAAPAAFLPSEDAPPDDEGYDDADDSDAALYPPNCARVPDPGPPESDLPPNKRMTVENVRRWILRSNAGKSGKKVYAIGRADAPHGVRVLNARATSEDQTLIVQPAGGGDWFVPARVWEAE